MSPLSTVATLIQRPSVPSPGLETFGRDSEDLRPWAGLVPVSDDEGMTNRATTLPFSPTSARSTTAELITARAIRRSLLPGFDLQAVAAELATLARHQRQPINRAISHIDRSQTPRTSQVIERAELALLAALDMTARPGRATAA